MAAYEVHMLGCDGAPNDYFNATLDAAADWFDESDQSDPNALQAAIMAGLPGGFDRYDEDDLRELLFQLRVSTTPPYAAISRAFLTKSSPPPKT